MPYESERANITLALCGDIMPSRRLAVYREPDFLKLREILCTADATFAKLYPVDLGFGRPRSERGRPLLAQAELGKTILNRVGRLSEQYGTKIQNVEGHGVMRFK